MVNDAPTVLPDPTEQNPPDVLAGVFDSLGAELRLRLILRLSGHIGKSVDDKPVPPVVASPTKVAKEFNLPLGRLSYHVRMLVQRGGLTLVEAVPVRGAREHRYKLSPAAELWVSYIGLVDMVPVDEAEAALAAAA